MSADDDLLFRPEQFKGRVRLFPLPDLVMFPHVLQPLHVFEPRYRELLEEALADDRLIAMALLAPGWEADYEGRPPLYPVACLGRVATHVRLDDGRYNVLLAGLTRIALVRELPPTKPFREAKARLYGDCYPADGALARAALLEKLLEEFKRVLPKLSKAHEPLEQLLDSDISLGALTDVVAYSLNMEISFKKRLLEERNVDARAAMLLTLLEGIKASSTARTARPGKYPPDFSEN